MHNGVLLAPDSGSPIAVSDSPDIDGLLAAQPVQTPEDPDR